MPLFEMRFENNRGTIVFGDGKDGKIRTISALGLALPSYESNTIQNIDGRGQRTISRKMLARTITISADVIGDSQYMLSRMARILGEDGQLTVRFGNKKRKIKCYCASFSDPERICPGVASVVVQFTCDDPAFADIADTNISVFRRQDMIYGEYTLPMVFTIRTNDADILVAGDIETEPVFTIYNTNSDEVSLQDTEYGIEIRNETTGKFIKLNYHTTDGETITIDIPNAEITSSVQTEDNNYGNLLNFLSNDTYLTDFNLIPGVNHIVATNYNIGESISVVCTYNNRYGEAIY